MTKDQSQDWDTHLSCCIYLFNSLRDFMVSLTGQLVGIGSIQECEELQQRGVTQPQGHGRVVRYMQLRGFHF